MVPAPGINVNLLLVDHDPDDLLVLQPVLPEPRYGLILARSAEEALSHLPHTDFAAIILNLMTPRMDAFETAALIRECERSRYTPIIFLASLDRSEDAVLKCFDFGVVDYLVRPIVPAVLRSKVEVFVQLKRQAELLETKNIELQAKIGELQTFSYSVAHELRGPLARIDGFSQALLESQSGRVDEEGERCLKRVRASSQRMCSLVDDLLRLAGVSNTEMRHERVDLSAIAESVAADLLQREPERQVAFKIEPGVLASGDPELFHTALCNLIENAWKFTSKHGQACIEFGELEENGTPVYFVRDDGAGFDQASSKRLFQPFQRLHKVSEFPGSGIGLATAARIVKRHGGRLWAEGAVERGATFYFSLVPTQRS